MNETAHTAIRIVSGLGVVLLAAGGAQAQSSPYADDEAHSPQPHLMEEDSGRLEGDPDEEDEFFNKFTVAPEFGYMFFPKSELTVGGFSATVEARNSLVAKLHFDLGGDRWGFDIAPLFAMEFGGITPNTGGFDPAAFDLSRGVTSGDFQAVGGELTLVYRFKVGRFYPHIGLGFHGTYLMGSEIDYGTELYGRVPVGFSIYMGKSVAFVMEGGLMFGVTGIRTPLSLPNVPGDPLPAEDQLQAAQTPADFESWYNSNKDDVDTWLANNQDQLPENYDSNQLAADFATEKLAESLRFGAGVGFDLMIGLRFP